MAKKKASKASKQLVTTSAPVSKGTTNKGSRNPKLTYTSDGGCCISHMEYVTDAMSTANSAATATICNAQSPDMFTWLSAIATRFEMYRFKTLKFHFKTSAPTTLGGYAILAFDFDVYDGSPTKASMLTWKYCQKSSVWQNITLDVSPDSRMSTWRYCQTGGSPTGDMRLDDLGSLQVLINCDDAIKYVGEIYVEYTCEFRQPSYKLPPVYSMKATHSAWSTSNDFFGPAAGANPAASFEGNVPYQVVSPSSIIIPVEGQFLIQSQTSGTGISAGVTVTPSTPSGYPNADSIFQLINLQYNSTGGVSVYALNVLVGGVLLTFSTSGTSIQNSVVRLATYYLLS